MATANKRTIQLRCAACGGTLETEEDSPILTCPYCGAKEMIIESDAVKKERIRAQVEIEKFKIDEENKKLKAEEQKIQKFRKSFMRKFLIVCLVVFFIFAITAFGMHTPLAGLVGLVQTGLVAAALLIGNGTIKTKIPNLRQVLQGIAFLLIIVFLLLVGMNGGVDHNQTLDWPTTGLAAKLPVPDSEYGHVYNDSGEVLDCSVYHYSASQYAEYKNECRAMGFDQDQNENYSGWTAFNAEGDKLELYYYDSDKEMSINLTAAKPMTELRWPTTPLGNLIPTPKSTVGCIEWETNYGFVIYVGDTPKSDYDEYVSKCIESGFNVKYSRGTDYYYGDNEEGFHMSVSYYGNNIMVVRADEPYEYDWGEDEEEVTDEAETEEPASETTEESGEVSAEFKATMDEYEAFFDDYIAFMEKYNSADDTSLMAEDYTGFIEKFTTIMNDLNSIDPSSLSKADYDYYQQVLMRVFTKLAVLGI